jgi:hypothetical protein
MAGGLSDALALVVKTFQTAVLSDGSQLRAFSEPADVTPPCVFVPLPDLAFRFSKRCIEVTWSAYLVGPNAPTARGTAENIATVLDAVIGLFPYRTGDLYQLNLAGGGPPAQTYRLQWLDQIPMGGNHDAS